MLQNIISKTRFFSLIFLIVLLMGCTGGGHGLFSTGILTATPSEVSIGENTTLSIVMTAQKSGIAESNVIVNLRTESAGIATVSPNQCITDKFGQCSIMVTAFKSGITNILATADKYTQAVIPVTVTAASGNKIFQTSQNPINLLVGGASPITITALQNSVPQPNVSINIIESQAGAFFSTAPLMCTTDSNGLCNFTVFGLGAGSGVLQVTAPSYTTLPIPVSVSVLMITLSPAEQTLSPGPGQIEATAFLSPSGEPQPGVTITFEPSNEIVSISDDPPTCVTQPNGKCTINLTVNAGAGGSSTITASSPGYVNGTAIVNRQE